MASVIPFDDMARRRFQRGHLKFKNGYWVGRWREDVKLPDGTIRRRQPQVRLGTKAELPTARLARRALDAKLAEVNAPGYIPKSALPLNSIIDKWERVVLSTMRHSTSTSLRPQIAKHIRPTIGTKLLCEITGEVVEEWMSSRECSAQTKRGLLTTLRSIWRKSVEWGYASAPFPNVKVIGPPAKAGRTFTEQELKLILGNSTEPWRTLFWMLTETGVRAGEAFGLRRGDVDPVNCLVRVERSVIRGVEGPTKNGRVRQIKISPALTQALLSLKPEPMDRLFTSRSGGPLRPDHVVKQHLRPLLHRIGIPNAGLHAFRHGNATEQLRRGVPLRTVQTRLGHSDAAITLRIYAHVIEADQNLAVQAISGIIPDRICAPGHSPDSQVIDSTAVMMSGAGGGSQTKMRNS